MDFLHRLAAIDTNIDALLGWRLVPHLQDGALVIDGMDALDAESQAGLERWLAHAGPNGEPRRERVIRALKTGRRWRMIWIKYGVPKLSSQIAHSDINLPKV